MSLKVDITHRLGAFELAAAFETAGRLTALFGRSGAGKTTIVNAIAGLFTPARGRIEVDGEVFLDTEKRINTPRHRRRIGYVFQEGRLFPHLSVRQNLLYGSWFAGPGTRRGGLDEIVDLLGVGPLLQRRPHDLSGGEKQRVAIGRALLASPRLLLMDEPLASLDEARKAEILPYVERLRDEGRVPIVYVSHSIAEVALLATTVVVLSEGRVQDVGPVAQVMVRPTMFPLAGHHEAGGLMAVRVERHDEADGLTVLSSRAGPLFVPRVDAPPGTELRIHVRARDIMLATTAPSNISALNVLAATIANIGDMAGPIVEVGLDLHGEKLLARITRRSLRALELAPGRPVFAVLKSIAVGRRDIGVIPADPKAAAWRA